MADPVIAATDFVSETAEVMARIEDMERRWGKDNFRVLLAHRCTFGRVRSIENKLKHVDEVLDSIRAVAAGMVKNG